jgi:hypothetical protein
MEEYSEFKSPRCKKDGLLETHPDLLQKSRSSSITVLFVQFYGKDMYRTSGVIFFIDYYTAIRDT